MRCSGRLAVRMECGHLPTRSRLSRYGQRRYGQSRYGHGVSRPQTAHACAVIVLGMEENITTPSISYHAASVTQPEFRMDKAPCFRASASLLTSNILFLRFHYSPTAHAA
ncbi:hypothetical protein BDU57DRAFT_9557 [Ampelomyces quisqualis]|uniref:Uncharacterized protein n=1 Tax=Ampelomyces quisqualis TaxID=50730 RepID=A0A6A5QXV5_AMPQU|nr:hypothetical protein BDU57DRAFT_9557 [Ampelomyces quisqualis]